MIKFIKNMLKLIIEEGVFIMKKKILSMLVITLVLCLTGCVDEKKVLKN